MSELEPDDSRVVHGNAKPKPGDERFAQTPEQARQPGTADDADDADEAKNLDDDKVRNPAQSPSTREDDRQHEQSRDNEAQFEASDLDRGEAQYQSEPLIQQQHQADDWSDKARGDSQLEQPQAHSQQSQSRDKSAGKQDFETGQADYGSAQRKAEQESAASGRSNSERD